MNLGDLTDDGGGGEPNDETGVGLSDFAEHRGSDTEVLHVMNTEYTERFGDPVIHLFCRDRSGAHRHVEVTGHRPSFYIREDDCTKRVLNHEWVESHRTHADDGTRYETIDGDPLVRLYTTLPKHISGKRDSKGLRDYFEKTWEADVFYTTRFLIDNDIYTHIEVDLSEARDKQYVDGDYQVDVGALTALDDQPWTAEPRILTVDIEVLSPDGFPEPDEAAHPVTAITAHDSYTDAYSVFVLRADSWVMSDEEIRHALAQASLGDLTGGDVTHTIEYENIGVFGNESQMLDAFNTFVADRRPDMLSGWNSSSTENGRAFDYPYLINRCKGLNVFSFDDWSPLGDVWNGSWGVNCKGVSMYDMMDGYKKTIYSKPKGGMGLDNISNVVLDLDGGKLDIEDIDTAWRDDPATFLAYNVRDVQVVRAIDTESGATSLHQNLRAVTGAQFDDLGNNYNTLDQFILRFAYDEHIALPTNEKPERGWYYGAHVFEPKLGRHPNAVYPDVWSMYPNMIRNANMSPETLIGTQADLDASEYDEDDCRWVYIDTRPDNVKKSSDPQYERLYFVKPSIEQGFLCGVVDEMMEMKDSYDGTPLYDAVKAVVNSTYGVVGDSDTYGKGFRLYDWRMAEGITLAGRKMIQYSAEQFVGHVNDCKTERTLDGENAYLVGGDTDSCMCAMPFIDGTSREGQQTCIDIAQDACERVNDDYDEWSRDVLGIDNGEHYCRLEIESYAPWLFIPEGKTKKKAKKRYAEIIAWEEGEWFDPPKFDVTGIDVVRSDRAIITRETVQSVLEDILYIDNRDDARAAVYDTIKAAHQSIIDGTATKTEMARPKGMTKHPSEYGSVDKTPAPTYRGAKYANDTFPWEDLSTGAKPQVLFIENVRGEWPTTYTAETKEDGTTVDAIAVEHPEKVPDEFVIDGEKQAEKVLRDPLTPILAAMRWNYDDAISDTEQSRMETFM